MKDAHHADLGCQWRASELSGRSALLYWEKPNAFRMRQIALQYPFDRLTQPPSDSSSPGSEFQSDIDNSMLTTERPLSVSKIVFQSNLIVPS